MKRYVIFAGPNGAGKSTLYQTNIDFFDMPRVNLDELVRSIGSWKNPADTMKAGKMAVHLLKQYLNSDQSFNQETTLCGRSIWRNIELAHKNGFYVEVYFVGVESAELAVERINQRVSAGGHGIPEKDVVRRYKESIDSLVRAIACCDEVNIYDNTTEFIKIAKFSKGQCDIKADVIPDWCAHLFK